MGASAAEINSATLLGNLSVTEDLKDVSAAAAEQVTSTALNPGSTTFTIAGTDVPGKYYSSQTLALVAGAATIDLTSLPGVQAVIDATGLKLNMLRIRGEADGSNGALKISQGVANPYVLFGAAQPIDYPAGCTKAWVFEFDDKLADVAAAVKTIDLAGTGTDSFFVDMILG